MSSSVRGEGKKYIERCLAEPIKFLFVPEMVIWAARLVLKEILNLTTFEGGFFIFSFQKI